MKLIRFGESGFEKPGVLTEDGKLIDLSDHFMDYNEGFFGDDGINKLERVMSEISNPNMIDPKVRIGSPVARPSKIVCVGLNYTKHAEEAGMELPGEPVLFFKSSTSLTGPFDNIIIPKGSSKTDWEVELAVIIGKRASYVQESEALDYIAGYAVHNDVSERTFQLEQGGQWVKGKSADTFAPLGPWLVTKDELPNTDALDLWLKVNGETLQSSNTSDMLFKVPFLVSYISQFMTLMPGDVISTGTPFGVGMGFDPPRYLNPGDVVELGIEGLGVAKQVAVSYESTI